MLETCGGFHWDNDCPNPPQAITTNPNPSQPCFHCKVYGRDVYHCFTLHPELQQGQSQVGNAKKSPRFQQGFKRGKCGQQRAILQTSSKITQHQGKMICKIGGFSGKYNIQYGGTNEIQCAYFRDALRSRKHIVSQFKLTKIFLWGQIFQAIDHNPLC